jgi:hypothetical protein
MLNMTADFRLMNFDIKDAYVHLHIKETGDIMDELLNDNVDRPITRQLQTLLLSLQVTDSVSTVQG